MYMITFFKTTEGKTPFKAWLKALKDARAKTKIVMRIDRLCFDNPGDHKPCGQGVWEMRIDEGPGYRVYYAQDGKAVWLLLAEGDKRNQQADIERAKEWWLEHQGRKNEI
ncbi:type II toxin-antitoxin system RelE/ParE family toxin [Cedecea lapagei]|uniref:type II toxin-antitoxin system RelE/ParE family toxin n=1 Tax=Cedecea lapagei TaxID=158823 RepID=UPI001BD12702|nr:type II toxin-antitoxin system RelE/ParE family toxin [Cedecea lapagei]